METNGCTDAQTDRRTDATDCFIYTFSANMAHFNKLIRWRPVFAYLQEGPKTIHFQFTSTTSSLISRRDDELGHFTAIIFRRNERYQRIRVQVGRGKMSDTKAQQG